MRTSAPTRTLALLVILLSLCASAFSLLERRQLEGLGGIVDEWFPLGLNLRLTGTLGLRPGRPDVVLAPGYPALVAGIAAFVPAPHGMTDAYAVRCARAVFVAQAILLAASAGLLFVWLRRHVAAGVAFPLALVLGTNPYTVLLVGLLHYDIWHIFCLVVCCAAFDRALDDTTGWARMLGSGLLWGATTLVRPLTLLFPPFALLALLLRGSRSPKRVLAHFAVLCLGMAVVVGPYTARNYRVTGRFVPVNAEGWMAIWGSTVRPLEADPNHYAWGSLYREGFMEVFQSVTGEREYTRGAFIDSNLELEDAFREKALENIRARPLVYLGNSLRAILTLNLQINSVFIKIYQCIQQPGVWPSQEWFAAGQVQNFYDPFAASAFTAFVLFLTLLAFLGLARGVLCRELWLLAPGSAYAAICATHALSYMDLMYYYVKVPFLVVFAAAFLGGLRKGLPGTRLTVGGAVSLLTLAVSMTLTLLVLSGA